MKKNEQIPANVQISKYLGFGLTWALSTLLFLYLGTLADKWLGTKPAFTVIGAFVGAVAGFYYMYSNLMRAQRDDAKRDDGTRGK